MVCVQTFAQLPLHVRWLTIRCHVAISSLLQTPIVRTGLLPSHSVSGGHRIPSAKDITPVALTNIPHVDASSFRPYLKQAGSLYEAFQRVKEAEGDAQQARQRGSASRADPSGSPMSPGGVTQSERPYTKRKASGGTSRRGLLTVAPLSTVPSVYLEPGFRLENPRTFDVVSERAEIVRPPGPNGAPPTPGSSGRKVLATNAILQEKLSWYMDIVEVHLIASISTASTSFFAALGSLRELHAEAAASVSKIRELRDDLASLDKNMALGGMKIVNMRKRRENVQTLNNAIQQLQEVTQSLTKCEEDIDSGAIEDSLRQLLRIEGLIAGKRVETDLGAKSPLPPLNDKLIELRGMRALAGVDREIHYLRHKIGKSFEARLLDSLLKDLKRHVDSVPLSTTFQRWDKASQRARGNQGRQPSALPAYMDVDESLRRVLCANLEGLAASDSIKAATSAYRDSVWKEVKTLIRRHLPSSTDDDTESTMSASTQGGRRMTQQEKSSILARNLRDLDAEDYDLMLRKIYANVGEALRRLGTQVKVVLDITSGFGSNSMQRVKSPLSPPVTEMNDYMARSTLSTMSRPAVQQEDIQQTLDMSSLLGQAVDIAQAQITKILKVRSEQSTRLSLPMFLHYFHLNRLFADECEAISGRSGITLKTVVNAHIKEFVQHAANSERQKLIQSMDSDHWDAKDFGEQENELLTTIIQASTKDIDAWTQSSRIWSEGSAIEHLHGKADSTRHSIEAQKQVNGTTVNGDISKDRVRSATIDEQKFILPSSALRLLGGVSYFEQLITGIPAMTSEITVSLLDYLKQFNSRSSQLILGAGATRSAGLKNITTKHLALASQALSFVTALIPHMREFVRRHVSSGSSLMIEFDKVKRLYQEHQAGINDKLIDIMSSRATTHISTMRKINWDAEGSQNVNPYMETLVKETTTLHRVLSKHLPDLTVQMIMGPVFSSYREQWSEAFQETTVRTAAGKERYGSLKMLLLNAAED